MLKEDFRKISLEIRSALTRKDYWLKNESILEEIKKISWDNFNTLHLFLPIKEQKEIDTFEILSYFKEQHPDLQIVVPRTYFADNSLVHVLYSHEFTILKKNQYNIPEPIHGRLASVDLIDAVLVPLLGFDLHGHRVGYGKGFYDRFLSHCRADVQKIGLSLFEPIDTITDIHDFDIRLDSCITPGKTYFFS